MPETSEVVDFIRTNFPTLWTIDQVLLMRASPVVYWSVDDLVRALRASRVIVTSNLYVLAERGFVSSDERGLFAYKPRRAEIESMCEELDRFYRERPVTTIQAIIDRTSSVQTLAQDFELWRDGSTSRET